MQWSGYRRACHKYLRANVTSLRTSFSAKQLLGQPEQGLIVASNPLRYIRQQLEYFFGNHGGFGDIGLRSKGA